MTQSSSPRALPADELGALAVDVFGGDRVSVAPRLPDAIDEAIALAERTVPSWAAPASWSPARW